jgi:DNA processing protein
MLHPPSLPLIGAPVQGIVMQLAARTGGPAIAPISPRREFGAYEALWLEPGASFKTLAEKFAADPTALPSDFVAPAQVDRCSDAVLKALKSAGVHQFGVRIDHAGD